MANYEAILAHLALATIFLAWSSFINLLGSHLVQDQPIIRRPTCSHCSYEFAWHQFIPIISWIAYRGACPSCKHKISPLGSIVGTASTVIFFALFHTAPNHYFPAYFIFFSALLVTIRSDLETMLISPFVTLWLIPIAIGASSINLLPISPWESIAGALIGYFFLRATSYIFLHLSGKDGLGIGDADLLALIGAFTGMHGIWISVLAGSLSGSILGTLYLLFTKQGRNTAIPFGPFLALSAIGYILTYTTKLITLQLG